MPERVMVPNAAAVRQVLDRLTAAGQPFEVRERTVTGEPARAFVHAATTAVAVLDGMRGHQGADFVVSGEHRWTYGEFFADVDALAATLQADLGVHPGDRVAIAMRNGPDWLITFAAAATIGAVVVPLNSWGSSEDLEFTLSNCGAKVLAADLPRLQLAASTVASSCLAVLFSDIDGPSEDLAALVPATAAQTIGQAIASGRDREYAADRPDPADAAMLLYTSGSTGRPKGVITRHVAIGQVLMNMVLSGLIAAELGGTAHANVEAVAHLVTVPLFHATGLFGGFLLPGLLGQKIVLMRKWHAEQAMATIERERVTMLSSVPAILKDLATHPRLCEFDLSSISRTALAGAATPAGLPELLRDRLGVTGRATGYGMTESGSVGSAMSGPVFDLKPTSAGLVSPIIDVRVGDGSGQPLAWGAEGELQLRGITVTPGYWGAPDLTREAFTSDGWLRTGDLGRVDADGFLHVTGRLKEIVIRGGENIWPIEIENVAYRHRDAKEVAVFAVPDEVLGEELAMVCHRQPGSHLDESELRSHLSTVLPKFKVPRYITVTDTPLPRNASEKIHRLALRESFVAP
jgi:long-chain acyl-CoA synthetase